MHGRSRLNYLHDRQRLVGGIALECGFQAMVIVMNDDYFREHAARVRAIADRADPFTKKRLLDLAERYELQAGKPSRATRSLDRPIPLPPGMTDLQKRPAQS
jgi:hypothetical protein